MKTFFLAGSLLAMLTLMGCDPPSTAPPVPEHRLIPATNLGQEPLIRQTRERLPSLLGSADWDLCHLLTADSDSLVIVPLEAADEVRLLLCRLRQGNVEVTVLGIGVANDETEPDFSGWLWLYDLQTGFRGLTRQFRSGQLIHSHDQSYSLTMPDDHIRNRCLTDHSQSSPPIPTSFYRLNWSQRLEGLLPYLILLMEC